MRQNFALVLALLTVAVGCTATGVRQFTREVYEPAAQSSPAIQVFAERPGRVRAALGEALAQRGAVFEEAGPEGLLARISWADAAEVAASVDLGRLRVVVTQTERGYRSWSLRDFFCDPCIVRNGSLISQDTRLVEDVSRSLDPTHYRIEASVWARFEPRSRGTRVELGLEFLGVPDEVVVRSTGSLEAELLAAIESALFR